LVQALITIETLASEVPDLDAVVHPFVVVVSQDCELDWDYRSRFAAAVDKPKQRKETPNLLLCEARSIPEGARPDGWATDLWKRAQQNQDERWHFLPPCSEVVDAKSTGFGPLLVDFKRYFTVPMPEVYERLRLENSEERVERRAVLASPYREHLAHRLFGFLSRVALPEEVGESAR
jgi:hypothetical protein